MDGQGLIGEQWLRTVVPYFYYWTSKHWILVDETWRTHEHVMDSVLKNDVIECTHTAASVQETLLRSCVLCCHRQRAPQPLRCLQWSGGCRTSICVFARCDYAFTTMNNNEIIVITLLMLMMVWIFEAVILTEV